MLAFDQIGFGSRLEESKRFYQRYPGWSLMGKMVVDTKAAIAAAAAMKQVDADRIYLLGHGLGGKVALFTMATDGRAKGAVVVGAFAPLRSLDPGNGAEGVRHYSHIHGLLPRLGYFLGQEERLPIDYAELIALAAPRPVLVLSAAQDRYHPPQLIGQALDQARHAYGLYGASASLQGEFPEGFGEFTGEMKQRAAQWLISLSTASPPIGL